MRDFVHLHGHSNFSFRDAVGGPAELVARAAELGMEALALTDHNGLYGAVRFYAAARAAGLRPILGTELTLEDGYHLTLLAKDREGYRNLCRLVTAARLRPGRETEPEPGCSYRALAQNADHLIALSGCSQGEIASRLRAEEAAGAREAGRRFRELFGRENFFIELCRETSEPEERLLLGRLERLAQELELETVATNNVHYLRPEQARAQDVLVCMQTLTRVEEWQARRRRGSERYLRSGEEMAQWLAGHERALENTARIAARCDVDLGLGELHFPHFRPPEAPGAPPLIGAAADRYLAARCREAIPRLYRDGATAPAAVKARLRHELSVIRELGFSEYFLVVWDIVRAARAKGIRCAGRGSAADSLVSYLLGVTGVDPIRHRLLFARFLNRERRGMPDVDIDFDSRRRDEILDYVYEKYGADRVAMVATINTFHARSAIRDAGKALGLPEPLLAEVSTSLPYLPADRIREAIAHLPELRGSDLDNGALEGLFDICATIAGAPRHLSVHLGGMIVTRDPLTHHLPLERSAKGVVVGQFDKDDVETLGLVKLDLLGLRNLSAIEETVELLRGRGIALDVDRLPLEDAATYAMLRTAETVGVFQLESPGMRGLLSRLQPTRFEDITANISLFRPGPMQADMISPYLARRHGEEPVRYPHPSTREALRDTYGVILYQEQVLQVASAVAGLTLGQADAFRRAMTHDRSTAEMQKLREDFLAGAARKGVERETAAAVFEKLAAFAAYGFCQAHAASFALIAYQTAYLKTHYPAEFLAAILSNQPMGFYPPEVILREAKRLGLRALPVSVNHSGDRYWIEEGAIRLPFNQVLGMSARSLESVLAARAEGAFRSLRNFCERTDVPEPVVKNLIRAGGFDEFGSRRELLWTLRAISRSGARREARLQRASGQRPLLGPEMVIEVAPAGRDQSARERTAEELAVMGLSPNHHPMEFYRNRLNALGVVRSADLKQMRDGTPVTVAGAVIARQRPPTRSGQVVIFITLEDETGLAEVTVFSRVYERYGPIIFGGPALLAQGRLQKRGRYGTVVIAERFEEWSRVVPGDR